jgi:hypothetical protein
MKFPDTALITGGIRAVLFFKKHLFVISFALSSPFLYQEEKKISQAIVHPIPFLN